MQSTAHPSLTVQACWWLDDRVGFQGHGTWASEGLERPVFFCALDRVMRHGVHPSTALEGVQLPASSPARLSATLGLCHVEEEMVLLSEPMSGVCLSWCEGLSERAALEVAAGLVDIILGVMSLDPAPTARRFDRVFLDTLRAEHVWLSEAGAVQLHGQLLGALKRSSSQGERFSTLPVGQSFPVLMGRQLGVDDALFALGVLLLQVLLAEPVRVSSAGLHRQEAFNHAWREKLASPVLSPVLREVIHGLLWPRPGGAHGVASHAHLRAVRSMLGETAAQLPGMSLKAWASQGPVAPSAAPHHWSGRQLPAQALRLYRALKPAHRG